MAHAALLHLMQLLEEELIQFSCRVLKIVQEKAGKLYELQILEHVPHSYVMDLIKELEPLAPDDLMDAARSPEVMLDNRSILEIIPTVLYLLDLKNSGLRDYKQKLDGEVIPNDSLSKQKKLASDLLASSVEFRKVIFFFKQVAKDAKIPYNRAAFLLRKLKDYDHNVLNVIKTAADEARDCMEEFLTMSSGNQFWWQKKDFMDDKNIHDLLKHIGHLLNGPNSTQVESKEDNTYDDIYSPMFGIGRGFAFSELSLEQEDFGMTDDDAVNNMIDELTGAESGLTIVETFQNGVTGKTTPLEKAFHHRNVKRHFDCRAWVNDISSTDKVLSSILCSIAQSSNQVNVSTYGQCIKDKDEDEGKFLFKRLRGRRYLIVLDGLEDFEVWNVLQKYFPDDKVGSRVVLCSVFKIESSRELSLKQEDQAVGLNEYLSKIIDELTRPPSGLSMVTITGMGGIGKTTLAKEAFNHPRIVHYFHLLAWVNDVSSADQVLSDLLQNIVPTYEEIQGQSTEDKGQLVYRGLKGRKYLIVVDGLWNFEAWDAAQRYLPDDKVGSRILITTRVMEFPSTSNIRRSPPHCITPLKTHQSWELLEKLVFGEGSCPPGLVAIGKRLAERCAGLPLSIVVIAGILRCIPRSFNSWWSVIAEETSIVSGDPEGCLDILALSYRYLPHHLKACFLYMGAFPANCEIGVEYLLNLWIANGFLYSKWVNQLETEAEKYLDDLIVRSLVSVGKKRLDGKPRTCVVHDLVRQLCLREAQKENFMHVVEAGVNAQDLEKQRHLIFNLDNLDDFQLLPPLPHLRSFIWLYFGSDFTAGTVHLQLSVFKWLRVVDLYYLLFDSFPSQLLNLVNLRYLALQVTYELDACISQLWKLQTLVIHGPWFLGEDEVSPTLYLEFWKMPWLSNVYVEVPSCLRYPYLLQPLSDGPQARSNLQSFSMITFSSCTKEVFLLMPNLKKLGVSETKEDFENGESAKCFQIFSFLTELEILKCYFYKGKREARSLDWDVLPVNLKRLSLKGCCLSWDRMKFLALLPKLETLKLKNYAFQGPEWVLTDEVFGSLKQLLIDTTDLVSWEVESTDHFPCLERVVLRSCKFLETIPWGVGELSVLELIELCYCSESAEASAREFQEQCDGLRVITRSDKKVE